MQILVAVEINNNSSSNKRNNKLQVNKISKFRMFFRNKKLKKFL